MPSFLALLLAFLTTDVYVAPGGSDDGQGASDSPFASLEKALSVALPGDRIVVRPGVYRVRLLIEKGGEPDKPIELVGEEGAILDGGESFDGWKAAPEMGAGVYVNTSLPYEARQVSWRGRTILNLGGGYTYTPELAREILRKPARDPYWEGVEANYALLEGKHYLRLRDGSPPRAEEFAFAPADSAVVRVANCAHVTLRGFRIRNAYWGVALTGANDCVVEDNFISSMGKAGVVVERGASRNHVRDNEITQDYVYPDFGHPWRTQLHHQIWTVWKDYSYGDRMGIRLQDDYGDENVIQGNHVFRCFDGIVAKSGGRGTDIHHNVLENIADDGLAPDGTEIESRWHDNLVIEGGNACIVVDGYAHTKGPIFIYRNRLYHTQSENLGDGIHFKNAFPADVHVYVFHNSVSGNGPSVSANDWTAAGSSLPGVSSAEHLYFLNNVFSSATFYDGWPNWPEIGIGRYAGNWVGGENSGDWQSKDFFDRSNVVAGNHRLWEPPTDPDFLLPKRADLRKVAIDAAQAVRLFSIDTAALQISLTSEPGAFPSGDGEPPKAPAELHAVARGMNTELSWKDQSGDETAFLIERGTDGAVFTTVARVAANATAWLDAQLSGEPSPELWYRVRAANFDAATLSPSSKAVKVKRPAGK
jgi:hypothetical protein